MKTKATSTTTPEEILALGKAGWQKYDELTISGVQIHFFLRPKRFVGMKNLDDKVENRVNRFLSFQSGEISRTSSSFLDSK